MQRFKYQMQDGREIWVCEACKKSHTDSILLRSWKLIDKKKDGAACEYCQHPSFTPQTSDEPCMHH